LRPRDPPAWHDEWPPGPTLPEAIRLAEGEDPGWPDLVVPLRITAPWYCGGGGDGGGGQGGDPGGDERVAGRVGGKRVADQEGGEQVGDRGGGGPGGGAASNAGCPGAENDGDQNLLAPATAAQRPFGENGTSGLDRRRGTTE
jgi:hypothetical protein